MLEGFRRISSNLSVGIRFPPSFGRVRQNEGWPHAVVVLTRKNRPSGRSVAQVAASAHRRLRGPVVPRPPRSRHPNDGQGMKTTADGSLWPLGTGEVAGIDSAVANPGE